MDVRYINPFLSSIRNVFDTMIHVPFNIGKPRLKEDSTPLYDISGIIGLSGDVTGCVVINLSKSVALQIASALLFEEMTEVNADCTDAIGEVANMISGNAKKDFPDGHVSISTPSVVIGKHAVVYPSNKPIISIPCETSAGRMLVDVCLQTVPVPANV
ncbi:MAG: chemotaxis protein CheX [Sedimentisphaerales bacterium]|nr:chemotaxis protein CheX [Sedimentisphaerales bacterium]MBN2842861.1 chemotaxis protein CheX [Sedimentisphaerales bacterium]